MNIEDTLKGLVSHGCTNVDFNVKFDQNENVFDCTLKFTTAQKELIFCAQQLDLENFNLDNLFYTVAFDYLFLMKYPNHK